MKCKFWLNLPLFIKIGNEKYPLFANFIKQPFPPCHIMSLQEIRIFITVNLQKYAQIFAKNLEYLHFFYGFSFRKL